MSATGTNPPVPSPDGSLGFSARGPGFVINVFPTGTATEESPAVVALSDTPKFGGGSSAFGGSSLGGGGMGGGATVGTRWTMRGRGSGGGLFSGGGGGLTSGGGSFS